MRDVDIEVVCIPVQFNRKVQRNSTLEFAGHPIEPNRNGYDALLDMARMMNVGWEVLLHEGFEIKGEAFIVVILVKKYDF